MDDLEQLISRNPQDEPSPEIDARLNRLFDEADRASRASTPPGVLRWKSWSVAAGLAMAGVALIYTSGLRSRSPEPYAPSKSIHTFYVIEAGTDLHYDSAAPPAVPQFWDGPVTMVVVVGEVSDTRKPGAQQGDV